MRASLQQKIKPPEPVTQPGQNLPSINEKVYTGSNKVDFKSVLLNSMQDVKAEREKKSGLDQLEQAESYEEFIETLNQRTQQEQRTPKNNLDKDDFLKLFVTQLQNQDPLKPKDGTEMAAQLAQFNSLEQMLNVSKGIERLEKIENAKSANDMIHFIGKEVTVDRPEVILKAGKVNPLSINIDSPVQSAQLVIKNKIGETIATVPLGDLQTGKHHLKWDGLDAAGKRFPDGKYRVELGRFGESQPVPARFQSRVEISGVDLSESGALHSSLGKINATDINIVSLKNGTIDNGKAIQIERGSFINQDKNKANNKPIQAPNLPNNSNPLGTLEGNDKYPRKASDG